MVTLAQIKTQSRERSDMSNTNFISDSELNSYVNASIRELYDLLVATYSDYYVADAYQVTVASDAENIPVPEDFYKLRGLDRSIDGSGSESSWWSVDNFNFAERNKYNATFTYYSGRVFPLVKYRIFGANLRLIPAAQAPGVYRIWYVPKATTLTNDSDSFDGINGWEEYVVVDCAIKMLQKQEDDVSVLMNQKQELKARIEAMAADRDAGTPERITDARGNNGSWGDLF